MKTLPVPRRCRQCGTIFRPIRRYDQMFCRPECRRRWHSWREGRGSRAVELLIAWRRDRRRGSLTKLTAFADELVRDYGEHEAERQQHAGAGSAENARSRSGAFRAPALILGLPFRTLGSGR
jgi:hypothetical protein